MKVIGITFNSTVTNTINRKRISKNVLSVNLEDDKMSINKLRITTCICLKGHCYFLPEVTEQASHILCENCVQTAFFQKRGKTIKPLEYLLHHLVKLVRGQGKITLKKNKTLTFGINLIQPNLTTYELRFMFSLGFYKEKLKGCINIQTQSSLFLNYSNFLSTKFNQLK